jgi:hypothetical protein
MVKLLQAAFLSPGIADPLPTQAEAGVISLPPLIHQTHTLATATVHVLEISARAPLSVAVSDTLKTVDAFAAERGAAAVLNAGFFDPQNGLTTSYVALEGETLADPGANPRLIHNPDLTSYLDQILNRSEFRRYDCAGQSHYAITPRRAPVPGDCRLSLAMGGGPQLLPTDTRRAEGFTDYANGVLIRDAIGSQQRNARSAVGITADGRLLWVMVAQRPDAPGMTLAELAAFMQQQGAESALNLDGGSSASMFVNGETYDGRLDASGNPIQRPVKSVLILPRLD